METKTLLEQIEMYTDSPIHWISLSLTNHYVTFNIKLVMEHEESDLKYVRRWLNDIVIDLDYFGGVVMFKDGSHLWKDREGIFNRIVSPQYKEYFND